MSLSSKSYAAGLFAFSLAALLTYWSRLLYTGVWRNVDDELPDLGGLARYLIGIFVLLAALWLVAHLNYRLAFRRWLLRRETRLSYWTWQCALAWLLFEMLQFRTDYEPEFVDENILVTGVLMGFVVAYGYVADSFQTRREQVRLIGQKTEAELTALKAQVNPHFLFNALNTIYNEAQRAGIEPVADLIGQLAGLMRFTLQESGQPLTPVENELAFLDKYLTLQRARLPLSDTLRLSTRLDWDGQPAQIAPLLLIPFIENAFQYGISLVQPSFIDLVVTIEDGRLLMQVTNSVPPTADGRRGIGTGLANVRQRLALTYPARHALTISQTADSYVVLLTLDL